MLKAACDNSFSPDCEGSTIWVSKDDETNSVYAVQKTFYDGGKIFTTLLLLDYLQLSQHKHKYLVEESYVVREMGGCSMREASTIRITADWRFRLEYYCVRAIAAGGGDHECVLIQIDWIEDSECKGGWWVGGGKEGRPAGENASAYATVRWSVTTSFITHTRHCATRKMQRTHWRHELPSTNIPNLYIFENYKEAIYILHE